MRPVTVDRARGNGRERHVSSDGGRLTGQRRHAGPRGHGQRAVQGDAGQGDRRLGSASRPLHRRRRPAHRGALRPDDDRRGRRRGRGLRATTASRARWACPGSARSTAARSRRSRSASRGEPCAGTSCRTCRAPGAGEGAAACCGRCRTSVGTWAPRPARSDGDLTQPPGALGGQDGPLSRMYIRRGEEVGPGADPPDGPDQDAARSSARSQAGVAASATQPSATRRRC